MDEGRASPLRGRIVERSVQVYHDEWGLFGITDALELKPDEKGAFIPKYGKKFSLTVIEYKPSVPRNEHALFADRMQLLAQKICVDRVFGTESNACFYYADTDRRNEILFEGSDIERLRAIVRSIGEFRQSGSLPAVQKSVRCCGCSMKDICLPKAKEGRCENYLIPSM